jgi:hypothetical protein
VEHQPLRDKLVRLRQRGAIISEEALHEWSILKHPRKEQITDGGYGRGVEKRAQEIEKAWVLQRDEEPN